MRESYITCPKCGGLAGYNSYFEAYICTYHKCNYIQNIQDESELDIIKKYLKQFEERISKLEYKLNNLLKLLKHHEI